MPEEALTDEIGLSLSLLGVAGITAILWNSNCRLKNRSTYSADGSCYREGATGINPQANRFRVALLLSILFTVPSYVLILRKDAVDFFFTSRMCDMRCVLPPAHHHTTKLRTPNFLDTVVILRYLALFFNKCAVAFFVMVSIKQ